MSKAQKKVHSQSEEDKTVTIEPVCDCPHQADFLLICRDCGGHGEVLLNTGGTSPAWKVID